MQKGVLLGVVLLSIATPAGANPAGATPASANSWACKPVRGEPLDFTLSPQEQAQVDRGDITVRHRVVPGTQSNEFFSAGHVQAPLNAVFAFYRDYRNTPKFQDSIKEITQVVKKSHYQELEYRLQLPFPIGQRHFFLDLQGDGVPDKHAEIWWSFDHGNIRHMRGSYVLDALGPNLTLVKYHIIADMNTWIPSWLVGFVQGGTIPNVIAAARQACQPAQRPN